MLYFLIWVKLTFSEYTPKKNLELQIKFLFCLPVLELFSATEGNITCLEKKNELNCERDHYFYLKWLTQKCHLVFKGIVGIFFKVSSSRIIVILRGFLNLISIMFSAKNCFSCNTFVLTILLAGKVCICFYILRGDCLKLCLCVMGSLH